MKLDDGSVRFRLRLFLLISVFCFLSVSAFAQAKKPATVEMSRYAAKGPLPIREAKQVIHRVEHTDDDVKSAWQAKVRHLLPEELHVREPLSRNCEHRFASIDSGDFVFFGQDSQDGAGTTSDLKD